MNRKELSQNHWKYYLMLEKRFVESIEFVELHEDNFDAFSNGYALLIQAIGAELDTVFKEFCGFNTTDRKTVADYAQYILTNTPDIKNQKISVQEYDIDISDSTISRITDKILPIVKEWQERPLEEVYAVVASKAGECTKYLGSFVFDRNVVLEENH